MPQSLSTWLSQKLTTSQNAQNIPIPVWVQTDSRCIVSYWWGINVKRTSTALGLNYTGLSRLSGKKRNGRNWPMHILVGKGAAWRSLGIWTDKNFFRSQNKFYSPPCLESFLFNSSTHTDVVLNRKHPKQTYGAEGCSCEWTLGIQKPRDWISGWGVLFQKQLGQQAT